MLARLHVLLGESVLLEVHAERPGQSMGVVVIEAVDGPARIAVRRVLQFLILQDQFYEFVVLVEEDLERVALHVSVRRGILHNTDARRRIFGEVLDGLGVFVAN